ncbi:MAG: 50S ribosomal protein L7/L12 [Candidatus Marinimicrobia bacterium]|nr:50S ribosomal protein L7/L12 [Candidatus Neomarinimicrobiota bacterium]
MKKDDVISYLEKANMLEISELIGDIEEKFGVTAAAPVAVAAAEGGDAGGAAEEKTEFDVFLTDIGPQKIQVIKTVRAMTDLGLTEAKEVVDKAPGNVIEGVSKEDAEKAKAALEEVGATVELK